MVMKKYLHSDTKDNTFASRKNKNKISNRIINY